MEASLKHVEADQITLELLQSYYNVPLAELAKELGLSLTLLKKICRKFGIQRWPHRQIRSINKSAQELQEKINTCCTHEERADLQAQLGLLEKKKRLVTRGASSGLQSALRNALFLANPEQLEEDAVFDAGADSTLSPPPTQYRPLPTPKPASNNSNPMFKMMQQMRGAQEAAAALLKQETVLAVPPAPVHAPRMYTPAPQHGGGCGGYSGGFAGHMAQDQVLLQQQMASHMAQLALQQQMQMNNYMVMAPGQQQQQMRAQQQQHQHHHHAQQAMHAGFPSIVSQPVTTALTLPDVDVAPFTEVAALLGMSDEDIALGSAAPGAMSDFDTDFMAMCAMDMDDMCEPLAQAQQQAPQVLPSIMQSGMGAPHFAAPAAQQTYMGMSGWAL